MSALSLILDTRFQLVLVTMVTQNNGYRYVCAGICKLVLRIHVCIISFQLQVWFESNSKVVAKTK